MAGLADEAADAADRSRSFVQLAIGTVVALAANGRVVVNIGGLKITMGNIGESRPIIGDAVRVAYTPAGDYACLGTTQARATLGVVASFVTNVSVTVTGSDGVVYAALPYLLSYTPVVGHTVAMDWAQGGLVLGRMSGIAGGNAADVPPPPPQATTGTYEFQALDSGSYSTRWWTNDVWYGTSNKGLWFYGTQVHDSLAGAVATGAQIYLPVSQASGNRYLHLNTHNYASNPGGNPTLGGDQQIDGARSTGWYDLDTGFAQYLIDNGGAGIGTSGPGLRVFTGRGANADSGRLRIAWRR